MTYGLNTTNRSIAYIYSTDISNTANSYKSFLDGKGYPTTLIAQSSITSGIFNNYGIILIGYDTGSYAIWGDVAKVDEINNSMKPILGLGEGGYAFFGKLSLSIGFANGWHGNEKDIVVVDSSHVVFNLPNTLTGSTLSLYTTTNQVGIHVITKPDDVVLLGQETADPDHYPLVEEENRYLFWGFDASPSNMTETGKELFENVTAYMLGAKEDLLGTWDGQGVYCRNSDDNTWHTMANPADRITGGDLDGDFYDDLIGEWSGQSVWVKYSTTGGWVNLASAASDIAAGDINGDGREDLLGTWDGLGVFYKSSLSGSWTKIATPADLVTTGDLDGDNIDDLIGLWNTQGGVWVKNSSTETWLKLSSPATDIASGDMNGDGKDDLLGTWDSQGVYYRDTDTGNWVKMAAPADLVACGDLDRDGIDDLIGIWSAQGGLWAKYSSTGTWSYLSSSARDLSAGNMSEWAGSSGLAGFYKLFSPIGGYAEGPENLLKYEDVSSEGPGGKDFVYQTEKNLIPYEIASKMIRTPGPGQIGFKYIEQKNLGPLQGVKGKKEKNKRKY